MGYRSESAEGRFLAGDPEVLGQVIGVIAWVIVVPRFWALRRHDTNGASIAPLTSNPGLVDVLDPLGANSWTYAYKGKKQRLDYLFYSTALANHLSGVAIERRGMADLSKLTGGAQKPFPTVTSAATAASDHAAVYTSALFWIGTQAARSFSSGPKPMGRRCSRRGLSA